MLDRPPKIRADRQRRAVWTRTYRRRLKAGVMVIDVEVDAVILDLLIRTNWLPECAAVDKVAIGRAIREILCEAYTRGGFSRR